jgi:beta-glucanase (GH16 family)
LITVTGKHNKKTTFSYVNPDHVQIISTPSSTVKNSVQFSNTNVVDQTSNTNNQTGKDALDPTASDSNWTNVWKDDFTSGTVDTSKWTVRDYSAGEFNNEQECYKDDGTHTRIDGSNANSHLVLEANAQPGDSSCPYISGRLDTQGKYAVQPPTADKPVRVEASIQLPTGGNGTWPAFWMLGQNIDTAGWPDCGEIDIMENSGQRNMSMATTQGTVHGTNDNSDYGTYTLNSGTLSDGYHLFEMDWYTDHITFSVDGHPYVDENNQAKSIDTASRGGDQVFNQPFFILLNFAIGGDWPGNADSSTSFPQQMNVNFVRVYQHN